MLVESQVVLNRNKAFDYQSLLERFEKVFEAYPAFVMCRHFQGLAIDCEG
jgi:hypothetical protein